MHLRASLAVIKYNDGLSGILELVEELKITACKTFIRYCNEVDKDRLYYCRYRIEKVYLKRIYSIKQSRRRRKRVGEGNKSCAYSFVTEASTNGVEL